MCKTKISSFLESCTHKRCYKKIICIKCGLMKQVCALTHPPSTTFLGAPQGQGKHKCLTIHCEMLSTATETETFNALLTLGVRV